MKKKLKTFIVLSLLLVLLFGAIYFLFSRYYSEGFSLNTWINGVYCTGKSVEEVNAELLSQIEAPIVVVTDRDGNEYKFDLAKMNYQVDYQASLKNFMEEQNPYLWIENVAFHKEHIIEPAFSYDVEMLQDAFYMIAQVKEELLREADYRLMYTVESGYELYDGLSDRYDVEAAFHKLLEAIEQGETEISLEELDCYYDVPLSQKQEETKTLWKKLEDYYQCDIVYDMGAEQIEMTPALLSDFLVVQNGLPLLDDEDNFILDEDGVEAFVSKLAMRYDTYEKEREFKSTKGDVITITKGTYGTLLNQEAEIEFLLNNLLAEDMHTGNIQMHIPEYEREAYARGLNDIGDTYIEIDMTAQKLYCYVDNMLEVETEIVTGNIRRGMSTPEGIYYVYAKQTDRILRGEGYASPVDYWMPVKDGIGIHDANWRKMFGGEIYKTNGSHGCINVPPDIMPEIYELIEIGTPVIMFY